MKSWIKRNAGTIIYAVSAFLYVAAVGFVLSYGAIQAIAKWGVESDG